MKAVIVGCGRVGAALADELDRAGWQVLIIDLSTSAFDRLPSTFKRDRAARRRHRRGHRCASTARATPTCSSP